MKATLAAPMAVFLRTDTLTFWRPVLDKGDVAAFAMVEVVDRAAKLSFAETFPRIREAESALIADPVGPDDVLFKGLSLSLSDNEISGLSACRVVLTDFGLASAFGHWDHDFLKGDNRSIPAGARWITPCVVSNNISSRAFQIYPPRHRLSSPQGGTVRNVLGRSVTDP